MARSAGSPAVPAIRPLRPVGSRHFASGCGKANAVWLYKKGGDHGA